VFVGGREVPSDARGRLLIPNIPARTPNWEISGTLTFTSAATLYAWSPHMHYRGKDMTFSVIRPDGRETPLLRVSKYSPMWQAAYETAPPAHLPPPRTIK